MTSAQIASQRECESRLGIQLRKIQRDSENWKGNDVNRSLQVIGVLGRIRARAVDGSSAAPVAPLADSPRNVGLRYWVTGRAGRQLELVLTIYLIPPPWRDYKRVSRGTIGVSDVSKTRFRWVSRVAASGLRLVGKGLTFCKNSLAMRTITIKGDASHPGQYAEWLPSKLARSC